MPNKVLSHGVGSGAGFPKRAFVALTTMAAAWLCSVASAGEPPPGPTNVSISVGLTQSLLRLSISGNVKPGAVYQLETTSRLGGQPWTALEPVQAVSNAIVYDLVPPADQAAFFRVRLPQPALFRVEPAMAPAAGGTTLYVIGQCLGTNGQLRIGRQTVPVTPEQPGSVLRCVAPALAEGYHDVEWLENGRVVARAPRALFSSGLPLPSLQRLPEPPAEPPASPEWSRAGKLRANLVGLNLAERVFKMAPDKVEAGQDAVRLGGPTTAGRHKGRQNGSVIFTDYDYQELSRLSGGDVDCDGFDLLPATGELQLQACDVVVPGVGLDFAFVRTYRSRTGRTTPMGHNWDHSYNLYIEAEGEDVAVCDGTGRRDVLFRQADGTYSRDEFFWQGRWDDTSGNFILEFPAKGVWEFYNFGVRPAGGRIARIADAKGNAMTFNYDLQARLVEVVDTLGRTFSFDYTPEGFISSLRDFTGRRWIYTYHSNRSAGGGPGDLASVTTPPVLAEGGDPANPDPTGQIPNHFPQGKRTVYTYTKGAADDRLNHNLTSITDPKGQTWLQVTYHANTNPAEIDFDAVASVQRGIEKKDIRRGMVTAGPANRYAVVRSIVRDGVGNVCEYFYDSLNRPVMVREFTGRSNVQQPVTATENRPTGKLRADDPDYYQTAFEWNNDSLLTRYIWPDGDEVRCTYERDFDPAANPRKKGDLRVYREVIVAAVGDVDGDNVGDIGIGQPGIRVWRFEHDPRFGSPARTAKSKDANGGLRMASRTIKSKDANGGLRMASRTAKSKDANGGLRVGPVAGSFGPQHGHFTGITDPRGARMAIIYEGSGSILRISTTNAQNGAVTVCDFDYDARGRLIRCVHPADAEGRRRQDTFTWYTNGPMAGYLAAFRCDDGGLNLTTTYEYDARGNLTRCVDPRGNDTLWTYNALDQVVARQSPPAGGGQRVTTRCIYDANDNLVQVDHENRDASGALDGANPWWTSLAQFDALDRPVILAHEVAHVVQQGTVFQTNRLSWDANDNLVRLEGPRAVSGEDPNQQTVFTYDERDLLFTAVDAPGTGLSATLRLDYNPKSQCKRVNKIEALTIKQSVRDNDLNGVRRITDPAGNVTLFSYDRAGNLVRIRQLGQTNDVAGGEGNRRLAETRYDYDSLNRVVRHRPAFFDIFTELSIGDGEATTTFVYAPNGQLVSETDDLGRTTRYTYDTAGRCVAITDPAANRVEFSYDAAGNVTAIRQIDRSDLGGPEQAFLVTRTYDACDRLLTEADNVGNTTRYAYDSRDNLVRVTDPRGNDACYEYDGLSRLVRSIAYVGPCDANVVINTSHVEYQDTRPVRFTDGNSNVTRYAYDSLDRCVAVTNADGTVMQFAYDAFGNLVQTRDPNGTVVNNTYDLLDRCVRRDITPGPGVAATTTFEAFAYDGLSRLVLATNDAAMVEFGYLGVGVGRGEIEAREKGKADCIAARVTRDSIGNIKSLELPSGRVLTATHDALDRVTALNLVAGGRVTPLATFAYEGPDRLGRVARPNGINTRFNWNGTLNPPNQAGDFGWQQVLRVNHARAQGGAVIDQRGYAYDRNQNKTVRAQLVPFAQGGPLQTNRWEADALDRLAQSVLQTGAGASFRQYQLDANGNRQFVIEDGAVQPYTMDATLPEPADFQMNQYTLTPFGAFAYDANGNRVHTTTAEGEVFYQYDYADRLVTVQRMENGLLAPVASFTYDALGRCVTRTSYPPAPQAPQTVRFIYHPADDGSVVEEWQDGTLPVTTINNHIGGPSSASYASTGRIVIGPDGQVHHVLCDELGNALALTDASGTVLERYDYDDYGQPQFLDAQGNPLVDGGGLPVKASPAGLEWLYRGMAWEPELSVYRSTDWLFHEDIGFYDPHTARNIRGGKTGSTCPYYSPCPGRVSYHPQTALGIIPGIYGYKVEPANRLSMNVSVGGQTQGPIFGEQLYGLGTSHWGNAKVIEKATSGLKDTLKTQVRMAGSGPKQKQWLPSNFRFLKKKKILPEDADPWEHDEGLFDRKHLGPLKYQPITFRKLLDRGEAGDNVGLLLRSASNVLKNKHDTVKNSIANIR